MTSRINYNTPLKSVRTIRALKNIEQYDPRQDYIEDPARPSDADLMHGAGIAFAWENAPGNSKAEPEKKAQEASHVELKPPPQVLAPTPSSKVVPLANSKFQPPAGTEGNGKSCHSLLDANQVQPSTESAAVTSNSPAPTGVRSQRISNHNHHLPPKPTTQGRTPLSAMVQVSSDKPPQPRRPASATSVSQSGGHSNGNSAVLSYNRAQEPHSARRTPKPRGGQEFPIAAATNRHHRHQSIGSTLHADKSSSPLIITDPKNGESPGVFSPDEGNGGVALLHSGLSRGSQDYFSARLKQSQGVVGVKDFYLSGRHTPISTVPNSTYASRPQSCMPTRPNSASASEAGSHSDDGEHTDVGDAISQVMNNRGSDGRCQVSVLDGEHHESISRHTDPRARDFIMERFLPAAKAMVTETSEVSERRSQETPLDSPTRRNGRAGLLGRSRFAFKDQFAEEEEQDDVDEADVLFKCKFPWQMGALSAFVQITGPADSSSVEQSPSPSFMNKTSPSPTASFGDQKGFTPSPAPHEGSHDGAEWIYEESDGSATPKADQVCSFEDRALPPKARNKNGGSVTNARAQFHQREFHRRNSNRSLGTEPVHREYESERELSNKGDESSLRASPGVPRDRLREASTHGNSDHRKGPVGQRSPDVAHLASLGTLLRTTQLQRRELGRHSEAAIQAAMANIQDPIPPSSILNHHRNGPARAAAAAASAMSLGYPSRMSSTKSSNSGDAVVLPDETNYPRHLKVKLIRQQELEPSGNSGRSLESLNDEVWEASRESPATADMHDRSGKSLSSSSVLPQSAHEGSNSAHWPLAKSHHVYARTPSPDSKEATPQHIYARTPSSDSKDASFSSVSERPLRSPTNLAMTLLPTVQQNPSSAQKFSSVSILQPPLPKSPAESWLFKVRPPAPPSAGTNWQGPKKFLDYSSPDDSMDVKWEVLVKSENAQLRSKVAQEVQWKGTGPLEKTDALGSKSR